MEKRSFFQRLTGTVSLEDRASAPSKESVDRAPRELPQDEEAQLTIDMWQTPTEIIVHAIVGGVKPDDLDVSITHDMVTIQGRRTKSREVSAQDYYYQELFWGTFSRSLMLPQEIDPNEAEATIKNGLLTISLPKLDKGRTQKLKVKNE